MEKQPVVLSIGKMRLPEGVFHACFVDGEMREVVQYEINVDQFRVRWDTLINGWQYTVSKWTGDRYHVDAVAFAASERAATRQLFVDLYLSGIDLEAKRVQIGAHLM
jgi:hypothetical protein